MSRGDVMRARRVLTLARVALALAGTLALGACRAEPDAPFCEPGVACASASEASCAHGREAVRHGRARFAAGTCAPLDDATCAASQLTCALWGQCHAPPATFVAPRACDATVNRDFLASRDAGCARGTCIALGDDCAEAGVCRIEGRCRAEGGVCVADAASCAASENCARLGWCTHFALQSGAVCRPAGANDCARAETCRAFGNCGAAKDGCVACNRSAECRAEGLCQRFGTRCLATEAKHCQASAACQRDGRCRASQGACVR